MAECSTNSAGWFLKVMKIQNGVLRTILIPTEHGDRGWVLFEKCVKSFYLNVFCKQNSQESVQDIGVRSQNRTLMKQTELEEHRVVGLKENDRNSNIKLPNLAVVILKQRSVFSWGLIKV